MSGTDRFELLRYEVRDATAWVTLDRPEKLNAFTPQLYAEVRSAVRLAELDPAVEVIVITGSGRAFSTGGDLKETLERLNSDDPLVMYEFPDSLPFDTIRHCSKVTIAAVNGLCMAGGMMTALSCDILIAAEGATFAVPEGRVGLAESWLPNLLFGRVSMAHIPYLLLAAREFGSEEAYRLGLVTFVVPDDDLLKVAAQVVEQVRETAPAARTAYKEYTTRLIPHAAFQDSFRVLRMSDAQVGLTQFGQKDAGMPAFNRPPSAMADPA